MACEYGWRAAPPTHDGVATTNFSHKCYRAAGHAHSLHSCLDLCGPGASPVCPGSELETEFIYTFMSEAGYSQNWLGCRHHGVAEVVSFPSVPTEDALAA